MYRVVVRSFIDGVTAAAAVVADVAGAECVVCWPEADSAALAVDVVFVIFVVVVMVVDAAVAMTKVYACCLQRSSLLMPLPWLLL